ncbi:molecular chaperone SurA [Nitrincola sp. A-D6]|uniref:peptidylprolyl isomerase n=1 Tax=Nitrincola sp. A-D6 TaxID=1545442 RepID=UPI00051FA6B4|nr:peptidylprolyl isomerase [Nitrincola sp. A-D6]KGK42479.1 molecular chaperone SurA [Nitrincola sp. A-D6]
MITSDKWLIRSVLTFVLVALFSLHTQAQQLDRIVAVVNDDIIMKSELDQRTRLITEQIQGQGVQVPPADVLRQQVLDRLILDSLQLQIAEIQGLRISDRQLNETLEAIAAQNGLTLPEFREALIAEGQDYAQAREQIRRELLVSQVQQSNVNRRIQVSEQEIRNFLNSDAAQQRQAEFLLSNILIALPSQASPDIIQEAERKAEEIYATLTDGAEFADTAVSVSNAPNALNGGDLGWRNQSELPETLAAAIANLQPGDISRPIRTPGGFHILQVRDRRGGDVTLVEQTLVSHILLTPNEIRSDEQTRTLAYDLASRIRDGQPFENLARRYSDDPGSGSQGGDLGWTQEGQMVPEFEQVMSSTAVDQISEPFESRFGWHVLWVRDRRTQDMSAEMMENMARNTISQRKYNEELDNWLRELRSQAYVEIRNPG